MRNYHPDDRSYHLDCKTHAQRDRIRARGTGRFEARDPRRAAARAEDSNSETPLLPGQQDLRQAEAEELVDRRLGAATAVDQPIVLGAPVVDHAVLVEEVAAGTETLTGEGTGRGFGGAGGNSGDGAGVSEEQVPVRTTHFITGGRIVQHHKTDTDDTKFVYDYGQDGYIQAGDSKMRRSAVIRERTADFIRRHATRFNVFCILLLGEVCHVA